VQVNGRKLQRHGGALTKSGLIPTALPSWLAQLSSHIHRLLGTAYFHKAPSHVLINNYAPGEGIMPHQDGPSYCPTVAILSLAAPAIFRFYSSSTSAQIDLGSGLCSNARSSKHGQADASADSDSLRCRVGQEEPAVSVIVPARSLLLFHGDMYTSLRHGIDATSREVVDSSVINQHMDYAQALRLCCRCASAHRSSECPCTLVGMQATCSAHNHDDESLRFGSEQLPSGQGGGQGQEGLHACLEKCGRRAQEGVAATSAISEKQSGSTHQRHGNVVQVAQEGCWAFDRRVPRLSLTFRNAARELKAFSFIKYKDERM
jgi:hypothetical protein